MSLISLTKSINKIFLNPLYSSGVTRVFANVSNLAPFNCLVIWYFLGVLALCELVVTVHRSLPDRCANHNYSTLVKLNLTWFDSHIYTFWASLWASKGSGLTVQRHRWFLAVLCPRIHMIQRIRPAQLLSKLLGRKPSPLFILFFNHFFYFPIMTLLSSVHTDLRLLQSKLLLLPRSH